MTACPDCGHPVVQHSREPDIGCLHRVITPDLIELLMLGHADALCPCLLFGNSEADQ